VCPDARPFVLITCEHAGNRVPPRYRACFRDADEVLRTHRGVDLGVFPIAAQLAETLPAPLLFSRTTRLLVDLNRSPDAPDLFSEYSGNLPDTVREEILSRYYFPYRRAVTQAVEAAILAGRRVVHISVHSFTDVLRGRTRELDLALLFDPARPAETSLCERWLAAMASIDGTLRYRKNEPYAGADDGLTTALRTMFPDVSYAGVEIEIRQGLIARASVRRRIARLIARSLPVTTGS
jgi:predicted N-formylglutamate amidohydrolase